MDLRAGGVSQLEVRNKLGHVKSLDLLDFLTYVPLFLMIHESVVEKPLDMSRNGISESGSCKHIVNSLWQLKCVQKFPYNPFIFGFCIDAKIEEVCLCVIQTPYS